MRLVLSSTGKCKQLLGKLPDNGSEQCGPGFIVVGDDDTGGREIAAVCLRPASGGAGER